MGAIADTASRGRRLRLAAALVPVLLAPAPPAAADDAAVVLEPMAVTATRRQSLELETPVSVSAVPAASAARADIASVRELAGAVPNAAFLEFSARAISNPQFRGVGGSTANPGVTTYIDGVPQLSADTSSLELLDLGQAEFVRGAQGVLYGRNTLGGVITLESRRPLPDWRLDLHAGLEEDGGRLQRAVVGGPVFDDAAAFSLGAGRRSRSGYSWNLETDSPLDWRAADFGKLQLLAGSGAWTVRAIAAVESARDGDFALYDLAQLRAAPFVVRHDYTGYTRRLVQSQTLQLAREGDQVHFRAISGRVHYGAFETTDLDASERDDLRRHNHRRGEQLTQELQWASAADTRWQRWPGLRAGWIGGLFAFRQRQDQDVANLVSQRALVRLADRFLPLPPIGLPPVPVGIDTSRFTVPLQDITGAADRGAAALQDLGAGVYGQGEFSFGEHWQLALGLRYDRERKQAALASSTAFNTPAGEQSPDGVQQVDETQGYSALSPALRLAWQRDGLMVYAGAGRGYRAGGFNPIAPEGRHAYGAERSLNLEAGLKAGFWDDRVALSLALFEIRLDDLQLNVPNGDTAGRFYIQNAGGARNRGAELELRVAASPAFEPWLSVGLLDARFDAGSRSLGEDVGGRRLPFTDPVRGAAGATMRFWGLTLQPELQRFGHYYYDPTLQEALGSVTLFNLRAQRRFGPLQLELWGRNLGDRAYVPLAIPYTGIAPSGYVGENAAPRTLGLALNYDLR